MKRKQRMLQSSKDLKLIMPKTTDDKRFKPRIKLLTQVHTIRTARELAAKLNKFIALAS